MGEKLLNSFIASVVGCFAAVGTVWFLSSEEPQPGLEFCNVVEPGEPGAKVHQEATLDGTFCSEHGRFRVLEIEEIMVHEKLILVDGKTKCPLVEIRDGQVQVYGAVASERCAANELRGQKIQVVRDDPGKSESKVFGELAAGSHQGAYLALLSQYGNHSLNMGFDKAETGFIISQNNVDRSVVAQSIMPKPRVEGGQDNNGEAVAKVQESVVR